MTILSATIIEGKRNLVKCKGSPFLVRSFAVFFPDAGRADKFTIADDFKIVDSWEEIVSMIEESTTEPFTHVMALA